MVLLFPRKTSAEDRVDFKLGYYLEDHSRAEVFSPAFFVETALGERTTLKISGIYDAISGATPTGAPPAQQTREVVSVGQSATSVVTVSGPSGSTVTRSVRTSEKTTTQVPFGKKVLPMADFEDRRFALNMEIGHRLGEWTIYGGAAYSTESDYNSHTVSARISKDFNDQNTTVSLGGSFTHDDVFDDSTQHWKNKRTFEGLVGVTHLLDRDTLLTANYATGTAGGYLEDQYKVVLLNGAIVDEERPGFRNKHILFLALNRWVQPLRGSLELSYRLYGDTYGVLANTMGVAWFQKLGTHFVLSPNIRYYQQSAADFYRVEFTGDPSEYSADYRLSKMRTVSCGLKLIWTPSDRFSIDLAYDRYESRGLDGVTWQEAYPSANVITLGGRVWF